MSILENVYSKFTGMEQDYLLNHSSESREEYITKLFGGNIDEGAAILTEAIMCESPATTEEIEKFSYIKDTFNFFIRNRGSIDSVVSSFDSIWRGMAVENETFDNLEALLEAVTMFANKQVGPNKMEQADLFNNTQAFHYAITPDSCDYVPLVDCDVFKMFSDAQMELCRQHMDAEKNFVKNGYYIRKKTGPAKVTKSDAIERLK